MRDIYIHTYMNTHTHTHTHTHTRFPGSSEVNESACKVGASEDEGSISGRGRSPGGGHGNPLQYSCWRIPWTQEPGGL